MKHSFYTVLLITIIFLSFFSSCTSQPGNDTSKSSSSVASAMPQVDAPIVSPVGGYFPASPMEINITDATSGAVITWTTNGGANWEQTNSLTISDQQVVLTAKASKFGMGDSASVTATYYLLAGLQYNYSSDITTVITNYLNKTGFVSTNQVFISNGVYSNIITNTTFSNFNYITNLNHLTNIETNSVLICTTTNAYSGITNQFSFTNFTLGTLPILTIKPSLMIKLLGKGINLGNTLDATPNEGSWAAPAQQLYFDKYTNAGFNSVRITVTWAYHFVSGSYNVDPVFMNRVEQVVDWALSRNLYVVLNCHHEDWIRQNYPTAQIPKFESLWTQISTRFAGKSEKLVLEILNEPRDPMTNAQVNDMNSRILAIIRKTNPNRNIIIGADSYNSLYRMIDPSFNVPNDSQLIATFHYYNPWNFCGLAQGTWGSASDYTAISNEMLAVSNWSVAHNNIPAYMGEYGVIKTADAVSRIKWYKALASTANSYGISYIAWDDSGDFGIFNRSAGTFETSVMDAIFLR